MAGEWTLAGGVSGGALAKAGKDVDVDMTTNGTITGTFSDEAESRIVADTRRNWSTAYAGLTQDVKDALKECVNSLIANKMISYNLDAYPSVEQAQTLLDVNFDVSQSCLRFLRNFKSNEIKEP